MFGGGVPKFQLLFYFLWQNRPIALPEFASSYTCITHSIAISNSSVRHVIAISNSSVRHIIAMSSKSITCHCHIQQHHNMLLCPTASYYLSLLYPAPPYCTEMALKFTLLHTVCVLITLLHVSGKQQVIFVMMWAAAMTWHLGVLLVCSLTVVQLGKGNCREMDNQNYSWTLRAHFENTSLAFYWVAIVW